MNASKELSHDRKEIEAWIDVGGTFTDCYVWGSGQSLRRTKQLSSGLVPISAGGESHSTRIFARETIQDADDFWNGSTVRLLDAGGQVLHESPVVCFESDQGILSLGNEMPGRFLANGRWQPAGSLELDPGIEAPVLAVRRLLGCPLREELPECSVRLGTTRGTNALLTRRGAPTVLAVTSPFTDLLNIGDQTRPHLFELGIRRDDNLAALTVGIDERLDANGKVLRGVDEAATRIGLQYAFDQGYRSLAICLMHSYKNREHELEVERLAKSIGFEHVSRSSHLAPLIEIVARARTTVVDAYLSPVIRSYLATLVEQFGGESRVDLQVMTSAGGLVPWHDYSGKDSILSGPAGGVVALRGLSHSSGRPRLVGLDMGGTSTDVCRTGSDLSIEYESTKAGVRILTPTLPIETVASGGGSICWFDGVTLRVGPQSAGALPGPACYGRGGPLTITDLNHYLGRLPANQFPFPLDLQATEHRLQELEQLARAAGVCFASLEQLAEGLRAIANQQMAEAVRTVSISQGADPREHVLVGFGGAAGQHICQIADLLGIDEIMDMQDAGLLSALGMGLAMVRHDSAIPVYRTVPTVDWAALHQQIRNAINHVRESKPILKSAEVGHRLELRYVGTDVALPIDASMFFQDLHPAQHEFISGIAEAFHHAHAERFGYSRPERELELVSVRLEFSIASKHSLPRATRLDLVERSDASERKFSMQAAFVDDAWCEVPHVPRSKLTPGHRVQGPCVILNEGSTLVLESDWNADVLSDGTLMLSRCSKSKASRIALSTHEGSSRDENQAVRDASGAAVDVIAQTVFSQRLRAIATQMGLVLQQTAVSVNVKQRRDFSCAVFDSSGQLLASAPHVPVHLGAMGETVRAALRAFPDLGPDEIVVTNNPYRGGSHLPDVTVIRGVYQPEAVEASPELGGRPQSGIRTARMFVANRAHHADIGGVVPGSMSVSATRLGQEGVIIEPLRLAGKEIETLEPLMRLFRNAPHPPRNAQENLADLRAQIAANARGNELVIELAERVGWDRLDGLNEAVLDMARRRVEQFVSELSFERRWFEDFLDDGTRICVSIQRTGERGLSVDFTGTGEVSKTNFNANPSIVTAAVIYVLRTLIADDIPLNEGIMRAVALHVPRGVLNPLERVPMEESPAVAAGNVETSQRVVDVLLGAFGVAAASQGTMNNLLFGNTRFGFYETICGGAGAVEGTHGASGVHTHMTNTRLTDPEVLEARYPVRLIQFGLRNGSGGKGKWRGGDGVLRTIEFLEPVELSLLTSRRGSFAPYGMYGGMPGERGKNTRITKNADRIPLPGCCQVKMEAGEAIELQTPGGGGFGAQANEPHDGDGREV